MHKYLVTIFLKLKVSIYGLQSYTTLITDQIHFASYQKYYTYNHEIITLDIMHSCRQEYVLLQSYIHACVYMLFVTERWAG